MDGRSNSSANPRFRALVLGPFDVERDSASLGASQWQRRVQTLFKLLVTAPGRQRRRDDLIELLWPDIDPETGTGNLRMLVHRLRLAVGCTPSAVLSSNGWVALNPVYGWDLDLEEMEALVRDSQGDVTRLERAVAMVRGEPFSEDRYDDWAVPLTERATRLWRDACLQLATVFTVRGRHQQAAEWYSRLLEADPLDEEAARGLMTATARSGQPGDALRHYQSFRAKLSSELDVEPAAETAALAEKIRTQIEVQEGEAPLPTGGFLGAAPEGQLVGRAGELETALLSLDAAQNGGGRLVLVSGEAGVGKTRLAQEVMMRLRDRGFLIATARCFPRDQAVPFAPFLDLLGQIYAAVTPAVPEAATEHRPHLALLLPHGRAAPEGGTPEDPDDQYTLFRDCAGFLQHVSRDQPVALLLDDVQWSDEGSLDLMSYLAHEMRGSGVFILAAYRDGDISRDHAMSRVVREMVREGLVERLALGRLTPEATSDLVAALLRTGPAPAEFSEFVFRRTRGNPLFVRKLVHALGGRYRLVRQVGAGGMGRVFEALDERTGDRAAVKLMFARSEVEPRALLRFQQEGRVLSALQHPNIVRVRGTFVEEYASCIAMEMLDGPTLAELLRDQPLPLDRARHLALQILQALAAAHERGVVHRDVKPGNVMVLDEDRVKVTDFGIARLARPPTDTSLTSTGMSPGTPLYMAPEQVQGGEVDARADLYALGALMYEVVTGRPPFQADNSLAIGFMHVNEAPTPARAFRPGIPDEWDAVILRALAKSPADRFQSAVAMERAVAALPVAEEEAAPSRRPAAPGAPTHVAALPRKRSRALPSAVGLAVAIAAGALFLAPRLLPQKQISPALHGPAAVAVASDGNVYVSDQGNDRVVEFNSSGSAVAGWGTPGTGTLQFNSPGSLALTLDGRLDVVDAANRRIEVLRDGRQVDEALWDAGSLALDPTGDLFASDFGNNRIWEFAHDWQLIRTLRVPELSVGAEPFPAGMATDQQGNLYVPDRDHNRIVKLSPTGTVLATYGRYGTDRLVPGTRDPLFNTPSGVAVDKFGRIYVADTRNDRIVVLSPQGRVLTVFPKPSQRHAVLGQVVNLALDERGYLYAAEYFNNQVVKLSPQGKILWKTPAS